MDEMSQDGVSQEEISTGQNMAKPSLAYKVLSYETS